MATIISRASREKWKEGHSNSMVGPMSTTQSLEAETVFTLHGKGEFREQVELFAHQLILRRAVMLHDPGGINMITERALNVEERRNVSIGMT